jgi:hypothetical protein
LGFWTLSVVVEGRKLGVSEKKIKWGKRRL